LPSIQLVITDRMSLLSPLSSNGRSIPLKVRTCKDTDLESGFAQKNQIFKYPTGTVDPLPLPTTENDKEKFVNKISTSGVLSCIPPRSCRACDGWWISTDNQDWTAETCRLRIIMLSTHIWIRFPSQGLDDQKLEKNFRWEKDYIFWSTNCNLLIPGPNNYGRFQASKHCYTSGYGISKQLPTAQKRTSSTSKYEISSLFHFLRVTFALLDPDPADQNQCGSGSAAL
jgi:hypothetical protein